MTSLNHTPVLTKPRKAKVATEIMEPTSLTPYLRDMWTLYSRYYNVSQHVFFEKLEANDYYAVYTYEGNVIGFTGFKYKKINTPNGKYQTLYIGQSVIDSDFRGQSLMPRTCLSIFIKHYLRNPFRPLYVWCDSLTFKPYLIFANSMKTFFPTFKQSTPLKVKNLLDDLGKNYYGENYCAKKGIVKKSLKSISDASAEITDAHRENLHIAFFEEKNQWYEDGNGLLTIAPVNFQNVFSLLKKCFRKRFLK